MRNVDVGSRARETFMILVRFLLAREQKAEKEICSRTGRVL